MTPEELLEIAERASSMLSAEGLDGFDVYVREGAGTTAEVKGQKLDAFESSRTWGVGVRALNGGRMGFSYATGSGEAVQSAVRGAVENASSAEPDEYNGFAVKPSMPYPQTGGYDPAMSSVPEGERIARAMKVERAALEFDGRIKRVRKSSASFGESAWAISSSTGISAASRSTSCSTGIMVVAQDASGSQMGYEFEFSRMADGIDYEAVGRSAAEKAVSLLGAKKPPTGMFPVIIENNIACEFLSVLSSSFSAESALKGKSMLADKVGKSICSASVSIFDDGLMEGGAATRPFDDEGVPSEKTPLVESGILKGFLHNTYTARRYGAVSTGNGQRGGFRTQTGVGGSNLNIQKGATTPAQMISIIDKGLIVREVLGMHTANPITGDFSIGVSGMWVESGKIIGPVNEAAISGNIIEIFRSIDAVGSDMKFRGHLGAPSLLLSPISVSGE
jgi:PmbA protein